jgi:hypothetical protein
MEEQLRETKLPGKQKELELEEDEGLKLYPLDFRRI